MRLILAGIALAGVLSIGGCAHKAANKSSGDWRENLPAPVVESAIYLPAQSGSRETVHITGRYFKLKSNSKDDVITSTDLLHWEPARKIIDSSGTEYTAIVAHGAGFPKVYVRVYGENPRYSDPVSIARY